MVILESELFEMYLPTYALDTDGINIFNLVRVPSFPENEGRIKWIEKMVQDSFITEFHGQMIIDNLYKQEPGVNHIDQDNTIPTDQLSASEMYDYAESAGITPPFARDATVVEAIQAVKNIGYLFNRSIKNNITIQEE